MVTIERPINGISLNGTEFLLDDEGEVMTFDNRNYAFTFLRENGYDDFTDDEIEDSFLFNDYKEEENEEV